MKEDKKTNMPASDGQKISNKRKANYLKPTRVTVSGDKKQLFLWFGDSVCVAVRTAYVSAIIANSKSEDEAA